MLVGGVQCWEGARLFLLLMYMGGGGALGDVFVIGPGG